MTHHNRLPRRRNRRRWTAYERSRDGRGFGLDGHSCLTGAGLWPDTLDDVESPTLLAGLEHTSQ